MKTQTHNATPPALIRLPQLKAKTGLSRSSIYKLINTGELKPIKLTERTIAFLENEVDAWLQSRIDARG